MMSFFNRRSKLGLNYWITISTSITSAATAIIEKDSDDKPIEIIIAEHVTDT